MTTPQSLLLHSPLGILGMHATTPDMGFKPLGPGLEQWSTMWESRDVTITAPAGPMHHTLNSLSLPHRCHDSPRSVECPLSVEAGEVAVTGDLESRLLCRTCRVGIHRPHMTHVRSKRPTAFLFLLHSSLSSPRVCSNCCVPLVLPSRDSREVSL